MKTQFYFTRRQLLLAALTCTVWRPSIALSEGANSAPGVLHYTKGLRRRGTSIANYGEPDSAAYDALVAALNAHDSDAWRALAIHGYVGATSRPSPLSPLELINPLARADFDFDALQKQLITLTTPPDFHGDTIGAELAEIYHMALLRDLPLTPDHGSSAEHEHDAAWNALTTHYRFFRDFHGPRKPLPRASFLRAALPGSPAAFPGVADGPWLSQFLMDSRAKGLIARPVIADPSKSDYMTDIEGWRDVQSGVNLTGRDALATAQPRFALTGRDMARLVHTDAGFPELRVAFDILSELQPDRAVAAKELFEPCLADISAEALAIAFYNKWYIYRRIRPEELAGRVHFSLKDASARTRYNLHPELLRTVGGGILKDVNAHNRHYRNADTYLLPQAYPEGCPLHPSYPASHATFAGAAVTLLKALFDTNRMLASTNHPATPPILIPSADGISAISYTQSCPPLTVGGELNKLASNIAFARSLAGLHYRSDNVQGLLLGEAVALRTLQARKAAGTLPISNDWLDFRGQPVRLK